MPGKKHGLPAGGPQPISEHPPLPATNREAVGWIQSAVPGGAGEGLHSGPGYNTPSWPKTSTEIQHFSQKFIPLGNVFSDRCHTDGDSVGV